MKECIKKVLKSSVLGRIVYPFVQTIYRSIAIPIKRRRLQKHGLEVLNKLHEALCGNGIEYYLDFGTLLGVVRENDFIKHDDDIDLTILGSTIDARHVLKILLDNGFRFIHALLVKGKIVEFSLSYKKLSVDFCFFMPVDVIGKVGLCEAYFNPSEKYDNPDQNNYRVWYFPDSIRVREIKFKGIDVYVPEHSEELLELEYGDGWRSPVKNWDASKMMDRYKVMNDYAVRVTDIRVILKD